MIACAAPAAAQLVLTTTTTSSSTTTTTAAPTTTTTTTTASGGSSTTTTVAGSSTTKTTASSTTTTTTTGVATALSSSSGSLSISAPGTVDLQTASVDDGSIDGALGSVQVTDGRGAFAGGWTVTVTSSSFTTGSRSGAETISAGSVYYWSGPATATSGLGTVLAGQLTRLLAVSLGSPRTAFSCASLGSCSATWRPSIEIRFPNNLVTGAYEGAITHSVA